jgi:LytS/YehU family sensor histidine kinase
MTERLAALLRFSLDSTARDVIPLEEELKIVGDYLEIERTRYGPRLSYAIEVFEQPENPHVPPFSIQTLVENSVKHGGPDIRVTVQAECGRLAVDVWDSGDGFDESAIQPGHALDNLRSRLAALWGSAASLAISRGARGNTVRLSVPITSK